MELRSDDTLVVECEGLAFSVLIFDAGGLEDLKLERWCRTFLIFEEGTITISAISLLQSKRCTARSANNCNAAK